jgi:hypothetical protein
MGADGGLTAAPPGAGAVPAGDFIVRWATGMGTHPALVGNGTLLLDPADVHITLYLETDLPVLPAEGLLPDVAAWFGADGHTPIVSGAKIGPLMPGAPAEVSFTLAHAELQPLLVASESLDLIVAVTMTQMEAHGVRIRTGGDHASRVTFTAATPPAPFALPMELRARTITGLLPLPERVVGMLPVAGLNHIDIPIPVDSSATHLLVSVDGTRGGHTVDMDMQLLDAQGRVITWGVTPYAQERLVVQGDGLAPYRGTELTLRVMNHLGAAMGFHGTVEQG